MPRMITDKCNNCGACLKTCPVVECISHSDIYRINPEMCIDCMECVSVCAVSAIQLYIPYIEPEPEEI